MKRYVVDFIDQFGGWYTYDVYANSVFDAACELLQTQKGATVTCVTSTDVIECHELVEVTQLSEDLVFETINVVAVDGRMVTVGERGYYNLYECGSCVVALQMYCAPSNFEFIKTIEVI